VQYLTDFLNFIKTKSIFAIFLTLREGAKGFRKKNPLNINPTGYKLYKNQKFEIPLARNV